MSLYSKVIGLEDQLYLLKKKIERLDPEGIEKLKKTQEIQSQWLGNYGEQPFYEKYKTTIADNIFQVWGYNNAKDSSWLLYDRQKIIGSWAFDAKKKSEANESSLDYIRIDVRDIKNSDIPNLQSKADANYNSISNLRQKTIGNAIVPSDYNIYSDLNTEKDKISLLQQKVSMLEAKIQQIENDTIYNTFVYGRQILNNITAYHWEEKRKSCFDWRSENYVHVHVPTSTKEITGIYFHIIRDHPVVYSAGEQYNAGDGRYFNVDWNANTGIRFCSMMQYVKTEGYVEFRSADAFQMIWKKELQYCFFTESDSPQKKGYNIYKKENIVTGKEEGIIINNNFKIEIQKETYNEVDNIHPVIIEGKKIYKMIPTKNFDHAIQPFLEYSYINEDNGIVRFKAMQPKILTRIGLSKKHIFKEYVEEIKYDRKFIGYID